jgi:hypothetical protein
MPNNQTPPMDFTKCADCKKPFQKGQEYQEFCREDKKVMCFCLDCYKLYSDKRKV